MSARVGSNKRLNHGCKEEDEDDQEDHEKTITRKRGGRIVSRKTKVTRKKTTITRGAGIVRKSAGGGK